MRRPVEDTTRRALAPRLLGLIAAAAIPALILFPADLRPTILRVALAAALAIALLHLIGRLIEAAREHNAGSFVQALTPPTIPVRLDSSLIELRNEIRYSRTSRRYFDKVLRPRLEALAARRGLGAEELPAPPASGFFRRRGPSLASLADLIDHLETRR